MYHCCLQTTHQITHDSQNRAEVVVGSMAPAKNSPSVTHSSTFHHEQRRRRLSLHGQMRLRVANQTSASMGKPPADGNFLRSQNQQMAQILPAVRAITFGAVTVSTATRARTNEYLRRCVPSVSSFHAKTLMVGYIVGWLAVVEASN